jgi:hypothetical protein
MRDGSAFDWNNAAMKANPYNNRDQRLYATVLYEGVQWRVRPSDCLKIDPFSKIQVGHVYNTTGTMIAPGIDTREGTIENWNGGKTGYYVRKWVDPAPDPQFVKQDVPFKHIRYAEMLMNYAEACIELGQDARYVTSEATTTYRKADGSTFGAPIFSKADVGGDARAWDNKCYFFPIMRDELNKNDKLVQNPGY